MNGEAGRRGHSSTDLRKHRSESLLTSLPLPPLDLSRSPRATALVVLLSLYGIIRHYPQGNLISAVRSGRGKLHRRSEARQGLPECTLDNSFYFG